MTGGLNNIIFYELWMILKLKAYLVTLPSSEHLLACEKGLHSAANLSLAFFPHSILVLMPVKQFFINEHMSYHLLSYFIGPGPRLPWRLSTCGSSAVPARPLRRTVPQIRGQEASCVLYRPACFVPACLLRTGPPVFNENWDSFFYKLVLKIPESCCLS